jgi:hypothetical protein
MWVHKTG